MSASDWADAPYVRIYSTLSADHPKVWGDLRLLGAYVRLLTAADPVWPGLADIPRGIPQDVLDALVADEVVDVEGDLFRFHGLATERNGRRAGRSMGGKIRAEGAERGPGGRFLPASNNQHSDAGDAGAKVEPVQHSDIAGDAGDAGEMLVTNAGAPANQHARPPRPPARPTGREGVASSSNAGAPAQGAARPLATHPEVSPQRIYCEAYTEHHAEHRWWPGIGWKCAICEKAKADADNDAGLSFREKVERAAKRSADNPLPDDSPF